MADQRFNYSFQTRVLGTHPPPPPPQWAGGGPPFPAAAVGDYRIYNTTHLFLPYTYQQVHYYQYQDFSNLPGQAQQHYYSINNTRSTYYNVHNSDGNRVQFEDETVILDGSVFHRQEHARDHRDHQRAVDNIQIQFEDETVVLDGSVIHHRQQHARDQRAVDNIQRRDNQNNNIGLSEDQITRCVEIIKKNLRRDDDKEEESEEVCAICLDDLCRLEDKYRSIETTRDNKNNNIVGSLECKHEYHWDCIVRWLRVKNFCPLCKAVAFHQDAR